jgi:hypothetical protein
MEKFRRIGSAVLNDIMKIIEPEMAKEKQKELATQVQNFIKRRKNYKP